MTNRSKAIGTRWESAIVAYLTGEGFPAVERRALLGVNDKGDISGLPVVVEAKNCKTTTLAAWVDEATKEAANAGVDIGVVWHHRRGKASPGDGFVTMSGAAFVALLRAYDENRRLRDQLRNADARIRELGGGRG